MELKKKPNIDLLFLHRESDGTTLKAFPGVAASVKDLNTANLPGKLPNLLSNGDHIKLKITDPLVIYEIYRYKYCFGAHLPKYILVLIYITKNIISRKTYM
jgi:hypothetical protein